MEQEVSCVLECGGVSTVSELCGLWGPLGPALRLQPPRDDLPWAALLGKAGCSGPGLTDSYPRECCRAHAEALAA